MPVVEAIHPATASADQNALAATSLAGDARDWSSALAANAESFEAFAAEIEASGSVSHKTDFVKAGTALHLVKVQSPIDD